MTRHLILLCFVFSFSTSAVFGQKNGITFSPFNAAYYITASPTSQGYMGLGFERNVNEYITLKLEINKGFQFTYQMAKKGLIEDATYLNISVFDSASGYDRNIFYYWTAPSFEVNYQSKFFFRGVEKTGAYIATGIGIRVFKEKLHFGENPDQNYELIPSELESRNGHEETFFCFPLMLRIGARRDLDGFYPDFNMAVGYNLFNGKTINDAIIKGKYNMDVPEITGLTVTGSVCFGFGW